MPAGAHRFASSRHLQPRSFGAFMHARRRAVSAVAVVGLLVATLIGVELRFSYLGALLASELAANSLSLLLKEQFDGALRETDLILRGLAGETNTRGLAALPTLPAEQRQAIREMLTEKREPLAHVESLAIVLSRNEEIFSDERAEFDAELLKSMNRKLADNPGQQNALSLPFRKRRNSDQRFLVARRVTDGNGVHIGMVAATINLEYFDEIARRQQTLPDSLFLLISNEATTFAVQPEGKLHIGRPIPDSTLFSSWVNGRSYGYRAGISAVDGISRNYSFQRLTQYPFLVVVGLPSHAYLHNWVLKAIAYVSAGILLILLMLVMLYQGWRDDIMLQAVTDSERRRNAQDRQMRRLVESLSLPLLLIRAEDQVIILLNTAAANLLGATPAEFMDTHLYDLYVRENHRAELDLRLAETHSVVDYEIKLKHRTRSSFWATLSIAEILYESDEVLLVSFSDISERKAAQDDLWRRATRDMLTGVANRSYFMERAQSEWHRAQRNDTLLGVMLFDLDYFKRVNDQHGHAAGDTALQHFARLAKEELRETDLLGRVGGEEFVAVLPANDVDGTEIVAERIRARLEAEPVLLESGLKIPLTVSIGIARRDKSLHNVDALIRRADIALYAAKGEGRNRVKVWGAEMESAQSGVA